MLGAGSKGSKQGRPMAPQAHPNCIMSFCIFLTSAAAPILAIAAPAVPREVPTVLVVAAVCGRVEQERASGCGVAQKKGLA